MDLFIKKNNKPVIAITVPVHSESISYLCSSLMVRHYGGIPLRLDETTYNRQTEFQGLIISGGTDVFPDRYGGKIKEDYKYDHKRDDMELELLRHAEKNKKPVLAICRGAQLMNVFRGGGLHFDVSQAYEMAEYPSSLLAYIFYRKRMYIKNDTALIRRLLNCSMCRVNSLHRQAIDTLGDHLQITSEERNGVVQAIEDPRFEYFLGVQFHPEYMIYQKRFRRIFKKLVKCAGNM